MEDCTEKQGGESGCSFVAQDVWDKGLIPHIRGEEDTATKHGIAVAFICSLHKAPGWDHNLFAVRRQC